MERLAEVPKIVGIEEVPILCWWVRIDIGINLWENNEVLILDIILNIYFPDYANNILAF